MPETPSQLAARLRVEVTQQAAGELRQIARQLKAAGAKEAARYVMRCVKSVDGAHRHARRMYFDASANLAPSDPAGLDS